MAGTDTTEAVTLRFSRRPNGEQRNDEYGMTLIHEPTASSLEWVLFLDDCEIAAAYFGTRERAVAFAESIARRDRDGRDLRNALAKLKKATGN